MVTVGSDSKICIRNDKLVFGYDNFNIRPGMFCWVDMPEEYKHAYRAKFGLLPCILPYEVDWRSKPAKVIWEKIE